MNDVVLVSKIAGWVGVLLGVSISIPQIIKSCRLKTTYGVSFLSYILLILTVSCYLVRAIIIKEPIFIVSNFISVIFGFVMIILIWKFKKQEGERCQKKK